MNKITVVCCYNNKKQLDEFVASLENQTEKCDIILIENIGNKFSSCSQALNHALKKVKTEYVVFSHQDIILSENDMLENFINYIKQTNCGDIVGVAGAKGKSQVYTNIKQSSELVYAGKNRVSGLLECYTVDECFFGGHTKSFKDNPFDEKLCDNWHMYAIERCLNANFSGNKVYVCDIPLVHQSSGKINHAYNVNFYNISKAYAKKTDWIYTTCASAKTNFWGRVISYVKREISIRLNRY